MGKGHNPEEVDGVKGTSMDVKEDMSPMGDKQMEDTLKEALASLALNEAFVIDTDIGFDPDDIYALVVFLLALELRKIPHENVLLVSNADNTGEKLRARFIRQIASALSYDCYSSRDRFDDIRVVSGRPGSMILDENQFADKPGIGVGQYKRRGQPVVKPVRDWIYAQEEAHGESVVDAAPDALAEFLRRMFAKDAKTTWINIGAATNLDDCFTTWKNNNNTLPPINDIVMVGGMPYPEEGKKVSTNHRLDPMAFIRVLKAIQTGTQTDAGVIPLHIVSSMTTQSEKLCWLRQVKTSAVETEQGEVHESSKTENELDVISKVDESSKMENESDVISKVEIEPEKNSKVEDGLEKKSAAWLAHYPSVMQAIEANNSNPEDLKDILQTWCFDSTANDLLTVMYAVLLNIPKAREALLPMHPVVLKVREDSAHNDVGELLELRVGRSVLEHLDQNPLATGVDDDVISASPVRMSLLPLSDKQLLSFTLQLDRILEASDNSSWYIWLLLVKVLDLIDIDADLPNNYMWY